MLSSRYRNSVPSIAMQLREILQPRIKEWLDRISENHRLKAVATVTDWKSCSGQRPAG